MACFLLLLLIVPGSTLAGAAANAEGASLTIMHITDFHGALISEDTDRATKKAVGGAAVIASYIGQKRAEAEAEPGREVLLVGGGDMMQGSAMSNLSRGESVIAFMNEVGFQACAIGNHEFDWGVEVLEKRAKQSRFPWLAANVFAGKGDRRPSWAVPYKVVRKGKLKVGIIGVVTPETPFIVNPKVIEGLRFAMPEPIVNGIASRLREKGVDVVVVLAHLGGAQERDGSISGPVADFTSHLKGVDVVLDGHSHTVASGAVGSIPVLISGSNGRRIGLITLEFGPDGKGTAVRQEVLTTFADDVEPDRATAAIVEKYGKKFAAEIERVISVAAERIPAGRQESPLGSLVSDIMRRAVDAQIAFHNPGGIRADLEQGGITVGQIFRVLPFDNTIVTMYLTGEQVRQVLEEGTSSRGVVQVSGVRFSCRQEDPAGQRVKSVTLEDGTLVSPTERYFVATNDFMANGGDRFDTFKDGEKILNTQILLRDAVIEWLEAEQAQGRQVMPPETGRVELLR